MRRTSANVARDLERLKGVHPDLSSSVQTILAAMDLLGFGMMVTEGVRTTERQIALYAQGRTAPGDIVTDKNGTTNKSRHQVRPDGFGYAVDLAFLDNQDTKAVETYSDKMPWDLMGLMGEKLGLTWGGRWETPHDLPHLEKRTS